MGMAWKIGSPSSKRTGWLGSKTFQFIVNDIAIQSLSIKAVSGWALNLNILVGPQTSSREPRGRVRNRNGVFQVMIPLPKRSVTHFAQKSPSVSNRNTIEFRSASPFQVAVKPTGFLIHQPA